MWRTVYRWKDWARALKWHCHHSNHSTAVQKPISTTNEGGREREETARDNINSGGNDCIPLSSDHFLPDLSYPLLLTTWHVAAFERPQWSSRRMSESIEVNLEVWFGKIKLYPFLEHHLMNVYSRKKYHWVLHFGLLPGKYVWDCSLSLQNLLHRNISTAFNNMLSKTVLQCCNLEIELVGLFPQPVAQIWAAQDCSRLPRNWVMKHLRNVWHPLFPFPRIPASSLLCHAPCWPMQTYPLCLDPAQEDMRKFLAPMSLQLHWLKSAFWAPHGLRFLG